MTGTETGTDDTQADATADTTGGDDGLTGLLDADATAGTSTDDSTDTSPPGGSDSGETADAGVQAAVDAAFANVEDRVQSIMDRRINQLMTKLEKRAKAPAGHDTAATSDDKPTASPADDPAAMRFARAAFREELSAEMTFVDTDERKMATEYGAALTARYLRDGDRDEDQAGADAARDTAAWVRQVRAEYERRTIAALQRRGLLKDQADTSPTAYQSGIGASAADASDWTAGVAKAKEMYPHRFADSA